MPLNCNCFAGCWGSHSTHWPSLPFTDTTYAIVRNTIPYGSYVRVGNHIRVETEVYKIMVEDWKSN